MRREFKPLKEIAETKMKTMANNKVILSNNETAMDG